MELVEEVMGGSNDRVQVVKGKRTKRQRPSSPFALAMTASSSSGEGDGNGSSGGVVSGDVHSFPSPTTSAEFMERTEEEEDMANCLILLAQGQSRDGSRRIEEIGELEKFSTRRFTAGAATATGKVGFDVYECKTCNRCFPSFQALGGHRASHKKPKVIVDEKKALMLFGEDGPLMKNNGPSLNNKSKVHECSICGSEFSSGQALGGHMRRHRMTTATTTTTTTTTTTGTTAVVHTIMSESQETKKPRTVLSLDLNLPAMEDDRDSKFAFPSRQQSLVFSPTALVDCHY